MPRCQEEEMGYRADYELNGFHKSYSEENRFMRDEAYKVSSQSYRRTSIVAGILKNNLKT
jgi:hypothetical protein